MQYNSDHIDKASVMERYVKQGSTFQLLKERILLGKMNHGYLFTGVSGSGKYALAVLFSQMLFCSGKDKPCGVCQGCQKVLRKTHPDVEEIVTTKSSITVDQIRAATSKTEKHAYEGGYQVVIIHEAEKITPQGQNALLKTLEEPQEQVVFLLLTKEKTLLLPTILSRVQIISLPCASVDEIDQCLQQQQISQQQRKKISYLAQGSLGTALDYVQDKSFFEKRNEILHQFLGVTSFSEVLFFSSLYKD
ncbi:MAG: DNA polymerase III subunit delta', partial [Clostridiales bacterium]|nr:DNA polymerase III subunit delta' [Clostridiales bacterium]